LILVLFSGNKNKGAKAFIYPLFVKFFTSLVAEAVFDFLMQLIIHCWLSLFVAVPTSDQQTNIPSKYKVDDY